MATQGTLQTQQQTGGAQHYTRTATTMMTCKH